MKIERRITKLTGYDIISDFFGKMRINIIQNVFNQL